VNVLQRIQHGRVLQIVLDRPEKRNALSIELSRAILEAVGSGVRDAGTGAILVTANGKSFCAGMDLDEVGRGATEETNSLHEQIFTLGARTNKPLIAAVHGAALGGGTGLVANFHIVIAEPDGAVAVPGVSGGGNGAGRTADHGTGAHGADIQERRGAQSRVDP
jgi:enoyl-CoA hydratase/carnithine racemase